MTKYSDFVKSYMAKHGKTWSCAVCEIKKSGAYEKYKKGDTEKKEVAPAKYVRKPLPFSVGDIARRAHEAQQRDLIASQVKTIAPSPIPVAAPLVERPAIRQPTAPLVMPEALGKMIQDFARPTEDTLIRRREELQVKRNILYAILHIIRNRTHHFIETHDLNFTERKKTAYHKKLDALIKKVKKYATIEEDQEEFDDEMRNLTYVPKKLESRMFAKDVEPDSLVALEYLKKHKFRLFFRYTHYDLGGNWRKDKMNIWTLGYGGKEEGNTGADRTKSLINELTEMVKELQ